ncbi:type II and III secretion system protein family protein [Pantoea sp. BAV 3049]|uniref:type II and III secretion system protein family protein n=1 Tax=Pantoea sp. BAV 3049 TaxID=2654188 RepID=UPI00131EAB5B|nr:pilus assembly protein N-terminal domain-containing protein [Pantoea sp. BAV 3049]
MNERSWLVTILRILLIGLLLSLLSFQGRAETYYMQKGAARTLRMKESVETVFTSNPEVVDYQVINDREVVIYGLSNGRGDILLVQGGKTRTISVLVDPLIGQLNQLVQDEFPGSKIELKKVGDGYILAGTAADEESREAIHQVVGEALGLEREVLKTTLKMGGDSSQEEIELKQMNYISFKKLQNRLTLPMSNQVNVKITLVEINKNYSDSLGIDWSAASEVGDFILNQFKFNAGSLINVIHALGNESLARILAEPNLSVLSGETADFLVGGEVPVVTRTLDGTEVSYKEFGIKMFVAAKVESSQKVRLTLSQEVSSLDGSILDIPTMKSRKARTTIELADGESFVLAGLLSETERESLSKVPFIGDVPVLGALFRNTAAKRERTELVMIATVNLVRPISPRNIMYPSINRSSLLERFFNINALTQDKSRREVAAFMQESGFIQ